EIGIDLVVSGLSGAIDLHGKASTLEHVCEALCLRAGVGMLGDMHDQERRSALIAGHMRHGGEVAVLGRVVAELLAVAKSRLRQPMNAAACFPSLDDRWHIVGVSIDGHTTFDDRER